MTTDDAVERRLARRETHSSRAGAAIALAAVLAVLLLAAGVGSVVLLVTRSASTPPPWPGLPGFEPARPWLIVGGAAAVAVGAVLLLTGLSPGRRRRRRLDCARMVVLVDDRVVADEVADRVCSVFALPRRQVRVLVTRRRAVVRIVPTSGLPLEASRVQQLADEVVHGLGVRGGARVEIAERGVVGR